MQIWWDRRKELNVTEVLLDTNVIFGSIFLE